MSEVLATINLTALLVGFAVLNVVLWKARKEAEELVKAAEKLDKLVMLSLTSIMNDPQREETRCDDSQIVSHS
jgi:hypothetical protein